MSCCVCGAYGGFSTVRIYGDDRGYCINCKYHYYNKKAIQKAEKIRLQQAQTIDELQKELSDAKHRIENLENKK
jgi:hypothetical protein